MPMPLTILVMPEVEALRELGTDSISHALIAGLLTFPIKHIRLSTGINCQILDVKANIGISGIINSLERTRGFLPNLSASFPPGIWAMVVTGGNGGHRTKP